MAVDRSLHPTTSNPTQPYPKDLRLLRLPEVRARVGLSRSEIYRKISADPPTFPAPVKLGERVIAWNATEVDSWIESRIAARDAKAAI